MRAGAARPAAPRIARSAGLAAVFIFFLAFGLSPPAIAGRTLTVSEGTDFAIDLAPDGARAVIDLQGRLWVLPAAGGEARPITDGFGDDRLPRWSPDGSRIAFQSFRNGSWDVWVVRPDGGEARAVTTGPGDEREPAWTADGRRIVFAADGAGSYDIWSVDPESGGLAQLTREPADDYAPAAGPGGALAFVSDRSGKPALWLDDGSGPARLVAGGKDNRLSAPSFSPDGKSLAFVSPEVELGFPSMARQRVRVLDLASGEVKPVSPEGEDVFPFAPSWSGGQRLVYTADGHVRLRALDGSGAQDVPFSASFDFAGDQRRLRHRVAVRGQQAVRGIVEPVAAPDASVVFTALGDLWRRDAGGAALRLTDDAFAERDPTFSRDGRSLAFISDRSGAMQVWIRDLETGADRQVTRVTGGVRYPAFAPDGRTLAFQQPGPRGDQDFTIQLLDLASGEVRRLKAPPLWPGRMSFTGDGRRLTVAVLSGTSKRSREGVNRLGLIGVADGAYREAQLPPAVTPDSGALISPDGARAALIVDGALAVAAVRPDGELAGPPRELRAELADYPSWSADSRSIVYLSLDGLARIEVAGGRIIRLPLGLRWTPRDAPARTLVHAGRLFDGRADGYRADVDILVERGRIVAVRAHEPHPAGVPVVDAGGRVVLPGLMENHAHHQGHDGEWVGRAWLAYGVTSVVEPGGLPYESRELAESWDNGARPGPRLFFAGPQLDGRRRYFPFASHIADERRLGWELERAGKLDYALLKTYTRMTPLGQAEVIRRGRRLGLPASSHEIYPALAAGGERVEHLRGTSRAGFSSKQTDLLRSYADVVGIIGTPRAVISPTVVVSGGFFDYWLRHPGLADNVQLRALYPEAYVKGLQGFAQLVGRKGDLLREGAANARGAVAALAKSGARIVAGTDSPIFPYGLALVVELANYVEAGLTPAEALRTATGASADALGVGTDLGYVEPGRLADLVIVDGDPLHDMADLLKVSGVMRGGNYYSLGQLLAPPAPTGSDATAGR